MSERGKKRERIEGDKVVTKEEEKKEKKEKKENKEKKEKKTKKPKTKTSSTGAEIESDSPLLPQPEVLKALDPALIANFEVSAESQKVLRDRGIEKFFPIQAATYKQ